MPRSWKTTDDVGNSYTIIVPDLDPPVTEEEVNEFAAANHESWVPGGVYRMAEGAAPEREDASPEVDAGDNVALTNNEKQDIALIHLRKQMRDNRAERDQLARAFKGNRGFETGRFGTRPGAALLGGSGKEIPAEDRIRFLDEEEARIQKAIDERSLGRTGESMGGIGGALLGAGTGFVLGNAVPIVGGIPGMIIGGFLGAQGGGALGSLWDIEKAREARDITPEEAMQIIKDRAVEAVLWDAGFGIVLGPGGRVLGRVAKGTPLAAAISRTAKGVAEWADVVRQVGKEARDEVGVAARRGRAAEREGITGQASKAVGSRPTLTGKRLVEDLIEESGRVPPAGNITDTPGLLERSARTTAPNTIIDAEKQIRRGADDVRDRAMSKLDEAGAGGIDSRLVTGEQLRNIEPQMENMLRGALEGLGTNGRNVFEEAADAGFRVSMHKAVPFLEKFVAEDVASKETALGMRGSGARQFVTETLEKLRADPTFTAQGAQAYISGLKSQLRAMGDEAPPVLHKIVASLVKIADEGFMEGLQGLSPDLRRRVVAGREFTKKVRQVTDTRAFDIINARARGAEDLGEALTTAGSVTEIRDVRTAYATLETLASRNTKLAPNHRAALVKTIRAQRKRTDAGLIKGFIQSGGSLEEFPAKLDNPKYRDTLRELLTGANMGDKLLGRKVLEQLDRIAAIVKLKPPAPPKAAGSLGGGVLGGVGTGTVGGAITGDIQTGVLLGLGAFLSVKGIGWLAARAIVSKNVDLLGDLAAVMAVAGRTTDPVRMSRIAQGFFNKHRADLEGFSQDVKDDVDRFQENVSGTAQPEARPE